MSVYLFLRYLHILGILMVVAGLAAELAMIKPELSRSKLKFIGRIDGFYGLGVVLVISIGLYLWLGDMAKGPAFYSARPFIYIKLLLFAIVGILSIYPTVFFLKQGKGSPNQIVQVPKLLRTFIIIELVIMAVIPFVAELMVYYVG